MNLLIEWSDREASLKQEEIIYVSLDRRQRFFKEDETHML